MPVGEEKVLSRNLSTFACKRQDPNYEAVRDVKTRTARRFKPRVNRAATFISNANTGKIAILVTARGSVNYFNYLFKNIGNRHEINMHPLDL